MADRKLFALVATMIGMSIILSYTLSTYTTLLFGVSEFHFVIRQTAFGLLSITVIWLIAQLDPDKWLSPIGFTLFLGATTAMIAMPFLPETIVPAIGGAKRWIKLFGFCCGSFVYDFEISSTNIVERLFCEVYFYYVISLE